MAMDNLKEFSIEWISFGLLFLCLLSFAVVFVANNSDNGFGDDTDKFGQFKTNITSNLVDVEGDANTLLNISAQNNPEVSDLGSKDSVATSYGMFGGTTGFIDSFKLFFSWIFSSEEGEIIISVIVGMVSLLGLYLIYKLIRNGI